MEKNSSGLSKLLLIILVVGLAVLAYVNYAKRVEVAAELQKLSVKMEQLQTGNSQENAEAAKSIVAKVRKHFDIPTDVEPTVAQIVDVNALKAKNSFYDSAKNGDYLIVTATRAILYDPDKDMIIDIVPVQLQAPASSAASKTK